MIEKQLTLPYLEDWHDTGDGASVRLPIAIIELVPKSAKVHCIAAGHVEIKHPIASEKNATENIADEALSNPAITSVLLTCEVTK